MDETMYDEGDGDGDEEKEIFDLNNDKSGGFFYRFPARRKRVGP